MTNEVLLKVNDKWHHFTNPQQIITAQNLDEVVPALREIERLVEVNDWHAAGFVSYEAASAFDKAHQTQPITDFPLIWFGLYPAPRITPLPEPDSAKPNLSWLPTTSRADYDSAIQQIKSYIAQGKTYQVNYTMRLRTDFNADPWNFFLHLAQSQNNHAAYVDTGRYVIGSASPELFFELDGETITCRPMKGTTHRGRTTLEDERQAQWLKDSEKNRAENVMIVDMIRNDLGHIAQTGSVSVSEMFSIEKYPTLWQMTSTIQAKTKASLTEIFAAFFPCASITGAPKVSTMQIINELETSPRKIYTGSIGYIAPRCKAKFNVAIRTVLIDRESQTAEYGIGSGVVWDSAATDEYAEALLKARVLTESQPHFDLLETLLWTPNDGYFLKEKHIARLLDSAKYFDFPITSEVIETHLNELAAKFTSTQRVRLLLDKNGKLTSEAKGYTEINNTLKACLAKAPVQSGNIFLLHKTTYREMYDIARKEFSDFDDVLLFNEKNELTEFTIGNLVAEMDGKLYTPPVSCGLLAGTFRTYLIENNQVNERIIQVEELDLCSRLFLVNSVRKWQQVELATNSR